MKGIILLEPMDPEASVDVTRILQAWSTGDQSALELLTPIVYGELHRLARLYMAEEHQGHVLQPSALVNEAFMRLMHSGPKQWESRGQFYAIAARLMRQILVDFARSRGRRKRGEGVPHLDVAEIPHIALEGSGLEPVDLVDLEAALTRLAELNSRQAQIVELRFFGGLENQEIASILHVSEPTVVRDWRIARAWLHNALSPKQ